MSTQTIRGKKRKNTPRLIQDLEGMRLREHLARLIMDSSVSDGEVVRFIRGYEDASCSKPRILPNDTQYGAGYTFFLQGYTAQEDKKIRIRN